MKNLIAKFAALGFFVCGAVCSLAAQAGPLPQSKWIDYACSNDLIKEGYVVDAVIQDKRLASTCPGGKVFRIRDVASVGILSVDVCQGSTIPTGWVIIATVYGAPNCPGPNGYLAYRIEKVAGLATIDVCSVSPIPSGWVITATKYGVAACRDPNIGAYLAYTINNSVGASTMRVCSISTIPSGWVITASVPGAAACYDPNIGGYLAYDILNLN